MIFNFFLLLCFYLPFQIALNPAHGVDLASIRVFILILFAFWIFDKLKNKEKFFIPNAQEKLVVLFLLLSFISLFFAQNYIWGARKLLYLFSIFPLYFIARDILQDKEKIIKTLKTLVLSATLVSIIGILQFLVQFFWDYENISKIYANYIGPIFWGENLAQMVVSYPSWLVGISGQNYFRAIATFPDPHAFSMFLGIMLPLPVILFFSSEKKAIWAFSFASILIANILTFSRGGYLAITTGIIIFLVFYWKKIATKHNVMAGLMSMFFVLMFSVPGPVSQRFVSSFDSNEGSNAGRIGMWEKSIEIIKERPFFGTGIGNFSLEVDKNQGYRNPIYAHNTYLDIAVEEGVLTSLIWIFIIFITLLNFWIFSKRDMFYAGIFTSLIIFSAHSMVETSLYSPIILTLFLIIISPRYEKR